MNKLLFLLALISLLLPSCATPPLSGNPPTPVHLETAELRINAEQILSIGNALYFVRNEGAAWSIGGFRVNKGDTIVLKDGYDNSAYQRVTVSVLNETSSSIRVVVRMIIEERITIR